MPHLVLLGDSVFDNGVYVAGGADVAELLSKMLPNGWTLSMHAIDGSTTADVAKQIQGVPPVTTHMVLSVGGNDALMYEHLLDTPVQSSAEALLLLSEAVDGFELSYRAALVRLVQEGKDLTVCTIYNANIPDPTQARCVRMAVALFNDVILRVAREYSIRTIDLRAVCTERADYANDIEPSVVGGRKIASAITQVLGIAERASRSAA
jgi:GDSL-like Lipase/Acylhydrolase family